MTYKQIETAREIRLWIGQIIVPAAAIVVPMMTVPEVRELVAAKAKHAKDKLTFKKKREAES